MEPLVFLVDPCFFSEIVSGATSVSFRNNIEPPLLKCWIHPLASESCRSPVYLCDPLTTWLIREVLPDVLKCSKHPGAPPGSCRWKVKTTLAVLSVLATDAIAWYDHGAPWNLNRDQAGSPGFRSRHASWLTIHVKQWLYGAHGATTAPLGTTTALLQ